MTATKTSYRVRIVPEVEREIVTIHRTLESAQQAFRTAAEAGYLAYSISEVKTASKPTPRKTRKSCQISTAKGILAGIGTLVLGVGSAILVIELVATVIHLFI